MKLESIIVSMPFPIMRSRVVIDSDKGAQFHYRFDAFSDNKELNMTDKNSSQTRAGEYVLQVGVYKAFIPNKLPPDPPVQIDSEMLQLFSQANIALGRLDGASELLVDINIFVAM